MRQSTLGKGEQVNRLICMYCSNPVKLIKSTGVLMWLRCMVCDRECCIFKDDYERMLRE